MKTHVNYFVEIVYNVNHYPEYDDKIIKSLGSPHGSGMGGPGMDIHGRDMCWIFMQDGDAAKKFLKRAKTKLKSLKLTINLVKYASPDFKKEWKK